VEIDSAAVRCNYCGRDLTTDPRSYEKKLTAALKHPLPAARVRVCWLLGENHILAAVPPLISVAEHDEDLFVRRAAIEALAKLGDARAVPLMRALSKGDKQLLKSTAEKVLATLDAAKEPTA
jgi:HEAT repeat protein